MQRYYSSNPYFSGLGDLISGAVQQRHQVKAQEAAAQDRATMQIYGGMGQGLGNLANSYAQRSGQLADDRTQQQNRLGLLAAQQQGYQTLENIRSANDEHEYLSKAFLSTQGIGGGRGMQAQGAFGGMAPADAGVGTMDDGSFGGSVMQPQQATPPMEPNVPLPSIDPKFSSAYKRTEQEVAEAVGAIHAAETNKTMPVSEKNAIYRNALPTIFNGQRVLQRYQQPDDGPKMLGPNGQMGPMQMGWNAGPNGSAVLWDGKDMKHVAPSNKAAADAPVTYTDQGGNMVQVQGDFGYLPDGKMWSKTGIKIEDQNDGGDSGTNADALKVAIANADKNDEGKSIPLTKENIVKNYDAVMEAKQFVEGKSSLDKNLQSALSRPIFEPINTEQYAELLGQAVALYGPNVDEWPKNKDANKTKQMLEQLDARLRPRGTRRLIEGPR